LTVELLDRRFGLRALRVFDKRKATGASSLAIEWTHDLRRLADLRKMLTQIVFCGLIREVTYEQADWWHGSRREAGRLEAVR
jgi:hypothetical protein